jgi:hypothetical protein
MRRLLVAALVAASAGTLGAGPASAVCDPDFEPLCLSPCLTKPVDPSNPLEIRACPR